MRQYAIEGGGVPGRSGISALAWSPDALIKFASEMSPAEDPTEVASKDAGETADAEEAAIPQNEVPEEQPLNAILHAMSDGDIPLPLSTRAQSTPLDIPGLRSPPGVPPPQDPLDTETLNQLILKASPVFAKRFSITDILRNTNVTRAARDELGGTTPKARVSEPSSLGSTHSLPEPGPHEAEIERQRTAVTAIDADVAEEVKLNREVAALILERLENSKKGLEGLVKLLQALALAESAYAGAMASAAKIELQVGGHDGQMQQAWTCMSALPHVIAQAHRPLHGSLTSLVADASKLLDSYRAVLREVSTEATTVQRHIDTARKQLGASFLEHAMTCRSFDVILADRGKGRPIRGPENDPWATESKIVQEHQALQQHQDRERAMTKMAFQQVAALEAQRAALVCQVTHGTADCYRAAILPLQHELKGMAVSLQSLQPQEKLTHLRDAADTASNTARVLAARQAESIQSGCQELFCSPEIVRQGDMEHFNPTTSAWQECHFVLTRAGFLHWFISTEDVRPQDVLVLARCHFEAGKAPCFNIVEAGKGPNWLAAGRNRKLTFRASSVDECCEWAIAIREAIAVAAGKQLAFEDG